MKLRRVDGDSADFIPSLPETVADESSDSADDSETETGHQIRVLQAKLRFVLSDSARYFFEFLVFHWLDRFAWQDIHEMFRRWKVWTRDTRPLRANLAQTHLNLR